MEHRLLIGLIVFLPLANCFLVNGVARKSVIKTLGPTYLRSWGTWGRPEYCAQGTYAAGYEMKIEGKQGSHDDDTALNAIKLVCVSLTGGHFGGTITSAVGMFGNWGGEVMCPSNQFLKEFSLQVEEDQHHGDDTAANYIKFKCGSFDSVLPTHELAKPPGHGFWGHFWGWSEPCLANSSICGIQTNVETYQHGGDDTSLNDVKFFCCSDDSY